MGRTEKIHGLILTDLIRYDAKNLLASGKTGITQKKIEQFR